MIRVAIALFTLAVLTVLIGAYGIAGMSVELGKSLSMLFLILAVLSYIGSVITNNKKQI
ncbi:MAG: hypothetical protein Q7U04_13475 [Bacteriovorax sp.]|nr:hypothetical protein [Bacteriovorax sp.]